jgi:hypothetical protein
MENSTVSARDIQASLVALSDILFLTKQDASDGPAVREYMELAQGHVERLNRAFKKDAVQGCSQSGWSRLWGLIQKGQR